MAAAGQEDFNPATTKIYDVRDPEGKKDGVFVIGGLVGELIITFTCLLDYILANPQNASFTFTPEAVEGYIKDLLITEAFAEGALTLHLQENSNKAADEDNGAFNEDNFAKYA